jgi:hypothetical protein
LLGLSCTYGATVVDAGTGSAAPGLPDFQEALHISFTPAGHYLVVQARAPNRRELHFRLVAPSASEPLVQVIVTGQGPWPTPCPFWPAFFGEGEQRVYFARGPHTIACWHLPTGQVETMIQQKTIINGFIVRPDERLAVTLGGNNALLWQLPNGIAQGELKHPLQVTGAAFLPGNRLLTTSYDGIVRVRDLGGPTESYTWELGMGKIYSLALSPDATVFAAGVEKRSRIVLMDVPE